MEAGNAFVGSAWNPNGFIENPETHHSASCSLAEQRFSLHECVKESKRSGTDQTATSMRVGGPHETLVFVLLQDAQDLADPQSLRAQFEHHGLVG